KAFRVFNSKTRIVEENLHIRFSKSTPNVVGSGPDWLFDIDALTRIMNYEPIVTVDPPFSQDPKSSNDDGSKPSSDDRKKVDEDPRKENKCNDQEKVKTTSTPMETQKPLLKDEDGKEVHVHMYRLMIGSLMYLTSLRPDIMFAVCACDRYQVNPKISHLHAVKKIFSKAFRVFNSKTRIVEENLHIRFSKSTPNVVGSGPDWLFDIDALTRIMNYEPIIVDPKSSNDDGSKPSSDDRKKVDEDPRKQNKCNDQENEFYGRTYILHGITKVKTASTPMETQKPLLKDEDGKEVHVHMYRYQVNPKISHLHAVKKIFRYLEGQPKSSLWYPKDSPFDLVTYTDSDYAGASLDRKSTTRGC
nr:hypothetical protein [Tanacetum cinerariifolium]